MTERWWQPRLKSQFEPVRQYYLTHLGCSQEECAAALEINRRTVSRHLKKLRKEWPADDERQAA